MKVKTVGDPSGRVNSLHFVCPGCGDSHVIPVDGDKKWEWNGSLESPTLTPSILVRSGHFAPSHKEGDECWCGKNYGVDCYLCHSFVINGKIQFLTDCSHSLRGQTVDLKDAI